MVVGEGIEPVPATVISCYSGFIRPSRTPVLPTNLVRLARFELARPEGRSVLSAPGLPFHHSRSIYQQDSDHTR